MYFAVSKVQIHVYTKLNIFLLLFVVNFLVKIIYIYVIYMLGGPYRKIFACCLKKIEIKYFSILTDQNGK